MKIFFILAALLSLTASSAFALVDACSQGYGYEQWQQLEMLNPCRELLRQQCSTVALPLVRTRMWQLNSCHVMRQQCCQQLRQIAPESRCRAICTMAQAIMQQAEFSGGYLDQTQAHQAQEALYLPSMCGIYPGYCSTPCSITAVSGGCY